MLKKLKRNLVLLLTAALLIVSVVPAFTASAEDEAGVTVTNTLTDGAVIKSAKKTFFVTAVDENGNTVDIAAEFNGKKLSPNWKDSAMTSFTLEFTEEGENTVAVTAGDKTLTYTVTYQKAAPGELIGYATWTVEALTIGYGYIIEPVLFPVYEGENAAQAFDRLLTENGFSYNCTGTTESGFYLSSVGRGGALKKGSSECFGAGEKFAVPEELDENDIPAALAEQISDLDTGWGEGEYTLGEFDYTFMSGWMYTLNNILPNVGFADSYLSDGDVVRVQYTLYGYGMDIGFSMWGGDGYYKTANKDALLTEIAKMNAKPELNELLKNERFAAAYQGAMARALELTAAQDDVTAVNKELAASSAEAIKELENKNQTPPDNGGNGNNNGNNNENNGGQNSGGGSTNPSGNSGNTSGSAKNDLPKTGEENATAAVTVISLAVFFAAAFAAELKRGRCGK